MPDLNSKQPVMKAPFFFVSVFACTCVYPVYAQMGMINSMTANASKVELEKAAAAQKTKNKMGGIGGGESFYQIRGDKSPVVLKRDEEIFFEIKVEMAMGGAVTEDMIEKMLKLYPFENRKGDRVYVLSKIGAMGMGASQGEEIPVEFTKKAGGTYVAAPKKPLKPGQYAFIDMMGGDPDETGKNISYRAYAFMVD